MSVKEMIRREMDRTPDYLLEEISDFIHFLQIREEKKIGTKVAQRLSEDSFQKVWDNNEDAIYDTL